MPATTHDQNAAVPLQVSAPPPDAAPAANFHHGYIDTPDDWNFSTGTVTVRGWCFHAGGQPVRAFRARVGGRVFPGIHGRPRTDVAACFQNAAGSLASGFAVKIKLPAGRFELIFETEAGDGWHEFARRSAVRAGGFSRLMPARAWTRLLAGAHRGLGPAWLALPEPERRWLHATLDNREQLRLGQLEQYSARPVAAEKFPRPRLRPARPPKITVVTPSLNQARFLRATMESVLAAKADGLDLDYIVQDGGSTDGGADIIRSFSDRLKFWSSAPDGGQAEAVRHGLARAECGPDDIMAYLNADDLYMPGALRFVAEYFARHPEVDAVYGHRVVVDESGAETGRWITPRHHRDTLDYSDFVPQETLFWRKRIYDRADGIDPTFHFALDWDLLLRFSRAGARFTRLPYFLGLFRVHPGQKTSREIYQTGQREMTRLRRQVHGRELEPAEIARHVHAARIESSLLAALLRRGLRF